MGGGTFRSAVGDAGFQFVQSFFRFTQAGADPVITNLRSDTQGLEVDHLGRGLLKIRGMPTRGEIAAVKVSTVSADAGFTVYMLDRFQEGLYEPNVIYSSNLVELVNSEYPNPYYGQAGQPGYEYSYLSEAMRRLWQTGIGIPYEIRATENAAKSKRSQVDIPELYFQIVVAAAGVPPVVPELDFICKVGVFALA